MAARDTPYIPIAKLGKTHALGGMLHIYFDVEVINTSFKWIFIHSKTGYEPYQITSLNLHGEKGFIQFDEINSKEKAQRLVNQIVYIRADQFDQYFEEIEDDLTDIVGYQAYQGKQHIGEIIEIYDNSAHLLAEIMYNQDIHLVPLVEDFIVRIDDIKKQIEFNLPEGMLQL